MKDLKISTEISKELASSVLGLNVVYTESCEHRDGIIGIWTDMDTKPIEEINIYEFAFKCKVWAFNEYKIYLSSELGEDSEVSLFWTANFKIKNENKSFYGDTEFEAIIKACEFILNDKRK